jgi:hypothetical protein
VASLGVHADANDQAAGIVPPVGREDAVEGRDEIDVTAV